MSTVADNKTLGKDYNSINNEQFKSRTSSSSSTNDDIENTSNKDGVDPMTGGLFRTPEEKRRFIKQQLLSVGLLLFIDVGLPLAIYYVMKMYVSILVALILSGVPPFINVIVKFIRNRKVDALGCIFVFSYVLSGILSIISGDVRLALLRDSTVTCVIACAFLITLIPIKTKWFDLRPLTYIIAQSFVSELPPVRWVDKDGQDQEQPLLEFLWHHVQLFRLHNYVMTFLWGFFLMAEFITKLLMIKSTMSVDNIVWISNVIVIAVVCLLSTISSIGSTIVQKRAKKYTIEWRKENDYAEMYKSNQVNDPTAGLDQQNSIDKPKPVITAESTPQLV